LEGTIRTLGTDKAKRAALALSDICRGIELTSGAKINYNWHLDTPSTNNDPALCEFAEQTARALALTVEPFKPTMAGEDFAVYQEKIRGLFFGFGIKSPYGLHHPKFCADTGALAKAAELLAELALRTGRRT
jgi:metal-dependent amidase/aminoacylase/carboxypeptidase family protein